MKKLILIACAIAGFVGASKAGNWSMYDDRGNYYYGQYDPLTGRGHLYDSHGNYYWTNEGRYLYGQDGRYFYRSGNTWYSGN